MKSTKKQAPQGVKTQGRCSGHERCRAGGDCRHNVWWAAVARPGAKYTKHRSKNRRNTRGLMRENVAAKRLRRQGAV